MPLVSPMPSPSHIRTPLFPQTGGKSSTPPTSPSIAVDLIPPGKDSQSPPSRRAARLESRPCRAALTGRVCGSRSGGGRPLGLQGCAGKRASGVRLLLVAVPFGSIFQLKEPLNIVLVLRLNLSTLNQTHLVYSPPYRQALDSTKGHSLSRYPPL